MTELTRADLNDLRQALSVEIAALRRDMDIRFAQVDAKLDAKPGFAALYQAVATLAFGIGAVVTSTVVVLKNVGLMG
jgi:hypothetical protein